MNTFLLDQLQLVSKPVLDTEVSWTPKTSEMDFSRNLLNPRFERPEEILSLTETWRSEEKFLLIGGVRGILAEMKRAQVSPDIKTFTQVSTF